MTDPIRPHASAPGEAHAISLRAHGPAYSVIQECLRLQNEAAPLTRGQRFRGRSPLHPTALSWYQGALGEIEVARVLTKLGAEWTVLHAVPVGDSESDIDHVVIGPAGVFTLNTKHHAGKRIWVGGGKLLINGFAENHIRNSQFEGRRASKLLSQAAGARVTVTPMIVVVGAASVAFGKKAPLVPVLTSRQLVAWLTRQPAVLGPAAVADLVSVVEKRGTWHSEAVVVTDTLRHEQRFERLRAEVTEAGRRARSFRALVALAFVGSPLVAIAAAVAGLSH